MKTLVVHTMPTPSFSASAQLPAQLVATEQPVADGLVLAITIVVAAMYMGGRRRVRMPSHPVKTFELEGVTQAPPLYMSDDEAMRMLEQQRLWAGPAPKKRTS